jgi:ubiquitin carboxyl-terminal hydrolase 25/28
MNPGAQVPGAGGDQDAELQKALMASMQTELNNPTAASYEPLDPEQRKRENEAPCGMKNIGNTCYLNSLLQTYYNLPNFVLAIL